MELHIVLAGHTPLIVDRYTDEAKLKVASGARGGNGKPSDTELELCRKKLYLHEDRVVMPAQNVLRAIMDGGSYFKIGKKGVTTAKSSFIPGAVQIHDMFLSIIGPGGEPAEWKVDTRPVRTPSTGGMRMESRPMFDQWRIACDLTLDTDIIHERLFRDIMDAAGRRVGLGAYRPGKFGPYGVFVVDAWERRDPLAKAG